MVKSFILLFFLLPFFAIAQLSDSTVKQEKIFNAAASTKVQYKKPRPFSFLTDIPADVAGFIHQSFKKNNLTNIGTIAASTAILYFADQSITNSLQDNFEDNKIVASEKF